MKIAYQAILEGTLGEVDKYRMKRQTRLWRNSENRYGLEIKSIKAGSQWIRT